MALFKWAKEESNGSPMFAAALAAGSAGALPLSDLIARNTVNRNLESLDSILATEGGGLPDRLVTKLKSKMLDKDIAKKFHIIQSPNLQEASFIRVKPDYLPDRSETEALLRSGGLQTFEGPVNPIKAIRDIRSTGGYIHMGLSEANPVTLAHELGHARVLNKAPSFLGNNKLISSLDSMGRSLLEGPTRRKAVLAAILAGSASSDDDRKWLVPGAIAATQLPVLSEEAVASSRAFKALKALKDIPGNTETVVGESAVSKLLNPVAMDNAGKYLRNAWGTYGLASAGLLAAPLLAIGARSQWDKSRG
jgi:hypothetical protein